MFGYAIGVICTEITRGTYAYVHLLFVSLFRIATVWIAYYTTAKEIGSVEGKNILICLDKILRYEVCKFSVKARITSLNPIILIKLQILCTEFAEQ